MMTDETCPAFISSLFFFFFLYRIHFRMRVYFEHLLKRYKGICPFWRNCLLGQLVIKKYKTKYFFFIRTVVIVKKFKIIFFFLRKEFFLNFGITRENHYFGNGLNSSFQILKIKFKKKGRNFVHLLGFVYFLIIIIKSQLIIRPQKV